MKNSNKTVIKVEDLDFSYGTQKVLRKINLEVKENDFFAILGPNGGGKTTLLKIILGLIKPDRGKVSVLGESPVKARHKIGYVPQFADFQKDFPIEVLEVVMMSELERFSLFPFYKKSLKKKAEEIIETLGISNIMTNRVSDLSGGQRQRVMLARSMIFNPEILILDEPTASVDMSMEKDIFEYLKKINDTTTIIIVSHDIAFVSSYVNKVSCLNKSNVTHDVSDVSNEYKFDMYHGKINMIEHHCGL